MSRHEFIRQVDADKRVQYRVMLGLMGLFVGFGILGSFVAPRLPDRIDVNSLALWELVLAAVLVGIAAVWLIRWSTKVALKCPRCRKCLGNFAAQVVVATGRCGFCGEKVIEINENL